MTPRLRLSAAVVRTRTVFQLRKSLTKLILLQPWTVRAAAPVPVLVLPIMVYRHPLRRRSLLCPTPRLPNLLVSCHTHVGTLSVPDRSSEVAAILLLLAPDP